jgi:hypothetical protein
VRKLYDYSGVLLWIMSPLAGHDRTGIASYIARGGYDAALYLVGYGGSGHVYALHLHFLSFICIKILC